MVDFEESQLVAMAMQRYGGGFVKHLGAALIRADPQNIIRIYSAFPEYWTEYLEIARKRGLDKEGEQG